MSMRNSFGGYSSIVYFSFLSFVILFFVDMISVMGKFMIQEIEEIQ